MEYKIKERRDEIVKRLIDAEDRAIETKAAADFAQKRMDEILSELKGVDKAYLELIAKEDA